MPIPAAIWGWISGHGIWYPANLLAAMVLPGLGQVAGRRIAAIPCELAGRGDCDPRRHVAGFRHTVRHLVAAIADDSRTDVVGRAVDAAAVDRGEFQLDGRGESGVAAAGRLALVRRVAVRVWHRGVDRRGSIGTNPRAPRRPRPRPPAPKPAAQARANASPTSANSISKPCQLNSSHDQPSNLSAKGIGSSAAHRDGVLDRHGMLGDRLRKESARSAQPADKPVPPTSVLEFTALYATNCAACHGADGKLGAAPPLNDPLFRDRAARSPRANDRRRSHRHADARTSTIARRPTNGRANPSVYESNQGHRVQDRRAADRRIWRRKLSKTPQRRRADLGLVAAGTSARAALRRRKIRQWLGKWSGW